MGIMSADIQAHQGRVYSLNYSRDGTVLASGKYLLNPSDCTCIFKAKPQPFL